MAYKIVLYRELPVRLFANPYAPVPSGSMPSDGLSLADDSSGPTSSTLTSLPGLIDSDINTSVFASNSSYSIGLDLGAPRFVNSLSVYDDGTGGSDIYWSGSHDSYELYTSPDNSTWILHGHFHPLQRLLYSGSIYRTEVPFSGSLTARYFKLYANQGSIRTGGGTSLAITSLQASSVGYTIPNSGSVYREFYSASTVSALADAPPIPGSTGPGNKPGDIKIPLTNQSTESFT